MHFTARRGWINDPYGVHWDGAHYHLYYQAFLDGTAWSPEQAWGHAVSADLVRWQERPVVLTPQPFELGCWSGSILVDAGGELSALYTRVVGSNLEIGAIAIARAVATGRAGELRSAIGDVVVAGPPEGSTVSAFRDPFVLPDGPDWLMIVGAGHADGTGAVLLYRSPDGRDWSFVGEFCRGRVDESPAAMPEVWECPQLIPFASRWVLLVSVMKNGAGDHVAATVGDFDGRTFVHSGWRRLVFGDAPYATSAFFDRDGEPCVISWLREDSCHDHASSTWAGAYSMVCRLGLDADDTIALTPHPAVEDQVASVRRPADRSGPTRIGSADRAAPISIRLTAGGSRDIEIAAGPAQILRISVSADGRMIEVDRPGRARDFMPLRPGRIVDVGIDSDIVEVFAAGAYGSWRVP